MPIVQPKPLSPSPVITNPPKVVAPTYSTPLVDVKYTPIASLITNVSGSRWTVDYYSQVITADSQLQGHDPGQPKQYQQYKLIKRLELKVDSALTETQDTESKSMEVTGTAIMHSTLIPNKGDMFAASVGDGRIGVFQVGTSNKLSMLKQSVYEIPYTLIFFADEQSERLQDLNNKVVQTLYYVRDFLNHGQTPLITDEEYGTLEKLKVIYQDIKTNYMNWFYSRETRTLLVPGQITPVYDHFLTTYVLKIFNTEDHPRVRDLIRLNCGDDDVLLEEQLYSALAKRDPRSLSMANRTMGLVSAKSFSVNPMLGSIRLTLVSMVVYPNTPQEIVDINLNNLTTGKQAISYTYSPSLTRPGDMQDLASDNVLDFVNMTEYEGARPYIHPIHTNGYYVFSEAFYKNKAEQSMLEMMTLNYFHDRHNDPIDVYRLADTYHNWGSMERFYYLPILLSIIKSIIRRM